MINPTVKVGNKVCLNSGSPDLEVIALSADKQYLAVRWSSGAKVRYAVFPVCCVSRAQ